MPAPPHVASARVAPSPGRRGLWMALMLSLAACATAAPSLPPAPLDAWLGQATGADGYLGAVAVISGVLLYALQGALDDDAIDGAGSKKAGDHPPVSTLSVLRSPAVLLCFVFFFLITAAFGALQNFSAAALKAMYGLSLATSASCLSAYVLGGAAGIAAGGFLATKRAQEQIIAVCITFGACMSLLLASGVAADWAILPLMALMGAGVGVAGPSRDLLVRKAATKGLGEASYGRVYGFVYSGLDTGLMHK